MEKWPTPSKGEDSSSCFFGRHLLSHLENSEGDVEKIFSLLDIRFKRHLERCPLCRVAVKNWKAEIFRLKRKIPFHRPDQNEKKMLRSECHQILGLFEKREKNHKLFAQKRGLNRLGKLLILISQETFGILSSREFLKGILLAILCLFLAFLFKLT